MADGPILLDVHTEYAQADQAERVVIRLTGVLDISTVGRLRESVEPHLREGADVVVDLADVTFCDSTGLGTIVTLFRAAMGVQATFALRSPRRRVAAVLEMTGVDQVVTVHRDTDTPAKDG
jgi:anti-anti-sigma factor